jgi:hypothetical protein
VARRSVILLILILVSFSSGYSWFAFNGGSSAFYGGGEGESAAAYTSIKQLIIEGADKFLKSYSDMLLSLRVIEMSELSGLDYIELRKAIDSACDNLEQAKEKYCQLKNLAAITPYNQEVIDKLRVFDYDGFQNNRGLNAEIFGKVKTLLSSGDVRGVYNLFYEDLEYLLEKIRSIKAIVDSEKVLEISELWRVNQKYSELKLFAQYVSEVFGFLK